MDLDEFHRQVWLDGVDDEPGAPVAGVDYNFQRLQTLDVDIGQQMAQIVLTGVERAYGPGPGRLPGQSTLLDQALHLLEAGIGADRSTPLAHELHAVVV